MQVMGGRDGQLVSRVLRQVPRRCELTDDVGYGEQSRHQDAPAFTPGPVAAALTKCPPVVNDLVGGQHRGQGHSHLLGIKRTHVQSGQGPQVTRSQGKSLTPDAQVQVERTQVQSGQGPQVTRSQGKSLTPDAQVQVERTQVEGVTKQVVNRARAV